MAFTSWLSPTSGGAIGGPGIRDWVLPLRDAFLAVGFALTSDTGQANMETMTSPTAGGVGGYNVFAFTDPLQGTHPIVFKIEYGTAGSASTVPQIWITVGQGSDGAGGLTMLLMARTAVPSSSPGSTQWTESSLVSDGGGFYLKTWATATTGVPSILLERARTPQGEARGDALTLGIASATTEVWSTRPYTLGASGAVFTWTDAGTASRIWGMPTLVGSVNSSDMTYSIQASPGVATAFPLRLVASNVEPWVSNLLVAGAISDLTSLGLFTVGINGRDRTYKSLPYVNNSHRGLAPGAIPPMLWE